MGMLATPAAANDGECGPGDLCLFENILQGGGRWDDAGFEGDYSTGDYFWGTGTSLNDHASSARSRYSFWSACIYENSWYRGRWVCLWPGEIASVLNDFNMDDKASSNDF
jgi:hypothetical protein